MTDKISIIVPVYNVEKYLKECIESILSQTYKNIEIILIDDGSTDNSGKICDEYLKKDSRVKVIHKENGGLSDARNTGIEIASGKYIGFVDSDDYIAKDMYDFLYQNIKRKNAEISGCNRFLVYENKIEIYGKKECYEVMDSQRAIQMLCTIGYIGASAYTKLYEAKLFKDIRYPKGKINEDMYTTYKLFDKANRIVYDATPKYYYRQRSGSITNSKNINSDCIQAAENLIQFVEQKYPNILNSAIKNYIYTIIGVYDNILKSKKRGLDVRELKKKIKNDIKVYYPIIKKEKRNSKQRKLQLFLIRYFNVLYNILFLLYDNVKNMTKKKE